MKYLLLVLFVAVSGCATWIPAAVNEIEDGVYTISTTGNSFASSDKMRQKIDKKAKSVCDGGEFDYIHKPRTKWEKEKDYSTGMTNSYQRMEITVECKE